MDVQTQPTLIALGIGPGDPAYLTLTARDHIARADVVTGFQTALDVVSDLITGERLALHYRDQEAGLAYLSQQIQTGKRCVLCVYGDVNFSAGELIARAEAACGPVIRLPGISSVQVAMARAGLAMETSLFITLHKRADITPDKAELLAAARQGQRDLIVLPRPFDIMPPAIAQYLLDEGISVDRPAWVYERLTLPDERVHAFSLGTLARSTIEFSDLSILIVRRNRE